MDLNGRERIWMSLIEQISLKVLKQNSPSLRVNYWVQNPLSYLTMLELGLPKLQLTSPSYWNMVKLRLTCWQRSICWSSFDLVHTESSFLSLAMVYINMTKQKWNTFSYQTMNPPLCAVQSKCIFRIMSISSSYLYTTEIPSLFSRQNSKHQYVQSSKKIRFPGHGTNP